MQAGEVPLVIVDLHICPKPCRGTAHELIGVAHRAGAKPHICNFNMPNKRQLTLYSGEGGRVLVPYPSH